MKYKHSVTRLAFLHTFNYLETRKTLKRILNNRINFAPVIT